MLVQETRPQQHLPACGKPGAAVHDAFTPAQSAKQSISHSMPVTPAQLHSTPTAALPAGLLRRT